MKYKNLILLFTFFAVLTACQSSEDNSYPVLEEEQPASLPYTSDEDMQAFYDRGATDEQVHVNGEVIKNLRDDLEGSRHQKFILELASGQTVLISHNIDLASRIDLLEEGDEVDIYGVYEWNERGGVIHWTHHDPDGDHIGGWIMHENKKYEYLID